MVTKLNANTQKTKSDDHLPNSLKDSAQLIWQAGLGAFNKAQEEGTKAFEALVKEGVSFQQKTQSAAEEKMNEASSHIAGMASGVTTKASGQWDKLETIFEDRVAKALSKLGIPSRKDMEALTLRLDELSQEIQKLTSQTIVKSAAKPTTPRKRPPVKPADTTS